MIEEKPGDEDQAAAEINKAEEGEPGENKAAAVEEEKKSTAEPAAQNDASKEDAPAKEANQESPASKKRTIEEISNVESNDKGEA